MSISQTVLAGAIAIGVVGGIIAPKVIFPPDVVDLTPICDKITMRPGELAGQATVIITLVCDTTPAEVIVPTLSPLFPAVENPF